MTKKQKAKADEFMAAQRMANQSLKTFRKRVGEFYRTCMEENLGADEVMEGLESLESMYQLLLAVYDGDGLAYPCALNGMKAIYRNYITALKVHIGME